MKKLKLIECPRDAMQGIKQFIPTKTKLQYLQMLVNCGFNTLDVGSFVSPKAIPQMADTKEVIEHLDLSSTQTKLLTIVANTRGALAAAAMPQVSYIGFPFSISETFQMRNTHKTIAESEAILKEIIGIAKTSNKQVVVYISMGFGNPYGEPWNPSIVSEWVAKIAAMGVAVISLSDTVGSSTSQTITELFSALIPAYPNIEFGAHLHTSLSTWFEKIDAAYLAGCRRFDGAIQGYGGCPMAGDALIGNMPTEKMISYFTTQKEVFDVDVMRFESAHNQATVLFSQYH
ncbi:hydroxymethylglutaryl-CoA lyase [Aquimarina agarilytica]|uniref:hydroxymethylglutaryl-CoA lyase n=1 Tax=Aquimarina agarilytica TaxID=1087449 RepID=UPI0002899988|nr:hydroxymethylglutaryl-CoA lyase [Aquimarina agarilytica]